MIHTPINSGEMESQRQPQNQRVFRTPQNWLNSAVFLLACLDCCYNVVIDTKKEKYNGNFDKKKEGPKR